MYIYSEVSSRSSATRKQNTHKQCDCCNTTALPGMGYKKSHTWYQVCRYDVITLPPGPKLQSSNACADADADAPCDDGGDGDGYDGTGAMDAGGVRVLGQRPVQQSRHPHAAARARPVPAVAGCRRSRGETPGRHG